MQTVANGERIFESLLRMLDRMQKVKNLGGLVSAVQKQFLNTEFHYEEADIV